MYNEALSVPFIIKGPGIPGGVVNRKHLISALDLYPTLCDAAGITTPQGLRGKSALKVLRNFNTPLRKYAFAQIGNFFSRVAVSTRYKYALFLKTHTAYDIPIREAFFDMEADPGETKNLINNLALKPIIDNHRNALNNWMIHTNDPFVTQTVVVD
jgi:arylsulfatase A-like enzyme